MSKADRFYEAYAARTRRHVADMQELVGLREENERLRKGVVCLVAMIGSTQTGATGITQSTANPLQISTVHSAIIALLQQQSALLQ